MPDITEKEIENLKSKMENFQWGDFKGTYLEIVLHGIINEWQEGYLDQLANGGQAQKDIEKIASNISNNIPLNNNILNKINSISGVVSLLGSAIPFIKGLGSLGSVISSIERQNASKAHSNELGKWIDENFKSPNNAKNISRKGADIIYNQCLNLLHQRPKCQALTENCSISHQKYINRITMIRRLIGDYCEIYKLLNVATFSEFKEKTGFETETTETETTETMKTTKSNLGLLLAVAGLSIPLLKK